MKLCGQCGATQPLEAFARKAAARDGLQAKCRECDALVSARWKVANRERKKRADRAWRQANPDRLNDRNARRRQRLRGARPAFADPAAIRAIYRLAAKCREMGIAAHVDHIVPLKHPLVCGLHVAANLQPMDDESNLTKGNRVWPDMP